MSESEKTMRNCLLDESKVCDDCGECDRCDLDPNKICDNCCKCLAIEDEGDEFRTVTIDSENRFKHGKRDSKAQADSATVKNKKASVAYQNNEGEEPYELTPELIAYWENKLVELGEAPADDGLGEIAVSSRVPVKGVRKRTGPHPRGIRTNE